MREMTSPARRGRRPRPAGIARRTTTTSARRAELGDVAEIEGISAGGMPTRVKCLHVLVAHALAAGPGVNPLGDEALELLDPWWAVRLVRARGGGGGRS